MATTTNYSWTTPDDTALVKDGAAAIRSLGTAIDSTVFTNASAAIAKTIVDAKGDIIAATAADTVDRLAVGTNGQLLAADSTTATGLAWIAAPSSGGMTLISTTSASNTATLSLTSIPTTYNNLRIVIRNYKPATDGATLNMRFNSDSGANRHSAQAWAGTSTAGIAFATTEVDLNPGNDNSVATGLCTVDIPDYKNTTTWKICLVSTIGVDATTTTSYNYRNRIGYYNQTTAISSLDFFASSGNITSGDFLLYGVK